MGLTPQQNLRAYVDYLRDLGIYDLYRRDDPQTMLPESLRAAVAESAKRAPVVAARPAVAAQRVQVKPVAVAVGRPSNWPSSARTAVPRRSQPQ